MDLSLYIIAVFLFMAAPGPGILLNIIISLNYGIKTSLFSIFGMMTGLLAYSLISFFLIELLTTSNSNFINIVQFVGSSYVIYMGYKKIKSHKKANLHKEVNKKPKLKFYLDGLAMSFSGPKPIIFFTGVLPPFIDFTTNANEQFIILTSIFFVMMFLINISYSFLSVIVANRINESEKYISKINLGSGYFFILLGLFLLSKTLFNF